MNREQMVRFVMFILRTHEPARVWGGLRLDAEDLVDQWLSEDRSAA